jgi:ADP-ribose pyrophosphatase YjhB (NUDIX family)
MFSRKPAKGEWPHLSVQALIRKNTGEYLAIKRARPVEVGTWEFPGGRVDPGETIEEALEREIKKETNLKIELERFVGWGHGFGIKADPSGRIIDRFVMFFECRLIKGKLKFGQDTSDHKWASIEDIMEFKPLSRPVRDFFGKFRLIPGNIVREGSAIIK